MIKIITVYNSLNPGSLLQATSLYNKIKNRYDDNVCFLKINARYPFLSGIKLFLKLLFKLKVKLAFQQLYMPVKYKKILKKYNKSKKIDNNDDIFILGSDEIWNISRKKIAKHKIFWGDGLNQKRCISYAPSINNSTLEDMKKYNFVKDSLNNLYAISVRDRYSKEILEKTTSKKIDLVCDPTMLIDLEDYKSLQTQLKKDNYILIYGSPKRFSLNAIKDITNFAKKNNKKLISYYFYNDWCDEIIYGSPYEFLSLFSNADYVFTNTFHGTIFSIIYNKRFISFCDKNKKVQEVLRQFDLDITYSDNCNIKEILEKDFDYSRINKKMAKIREESEKYLFNSIDNILANDMKKVR